jgi:hypothetical protein
MRTCSSVYDFQQSHCLRPFRKLSHALIRSPESYEWHKKHDASEDNEPCYSR